MIEDPDRSRLDSVIDDVVSQMMDIDARSDLTRRVLATIEGPAPRPWLLTTPAFAAAALSLVVIVVGALTLRDAAVPEHHPVPSIAVTSGPPSDLGPTAPAPSLTATDIPAPSSTAVARQTPPEAPRAEAIFGPPTGRVGAASLVPASRIQLVLQIRELAPDRQPRTQELRLVAGNRVRIEARAGEAPGLQGHAAMRPQMLPDGTIRVALEILQPVQRSIVVTLQPGVSTRVFEDKDTSDRHIVIEATATVQKVDGAQR